MVEDLIKRLRSIWIGPGSKQAACEEAATLIEQQAARITALESERDALLAAAGKEAVAWRFQWREKGAPGWTGNWQVQICEPSLSQTSGPYEYMKEPLYTAPTTQTANVVQSAEAIYQVLDPIEGGWSDCPRSLYDATDGAFRRIVYTAPTAALEKGDGRDAWISVDERLPEEGQDVAFIVHAAAGSIQEHLNGRILGGKFLTVGRYPTFTVPGLGFNASHWQPLPAPPAALSQKAGEKQ